MRNRIQIHGISNKSWKNPSKKLLAIICMGLFCSGCATTQMQQEVKSNSRNLARLDNKVSSMEGRMLAMDLEVKAGNERVYEVRNRGGRKTGMTAHPMGAQALNQTPVRPAPRSTAQTRKAAPAANKASMASPSPKLQPTPIAAAPMTSTRPASSKAAPQNTGKSATNPAAQSGGANNNISTGYNLALPPETAVLTPAAQSNTTVTVPGSAVTPESVGLTAAGRQRATPMVAAAQMPPADAPKAAEVRSAPKAAPVKFSPTVAGEKNAYAQALNLVRGGQSADGREKFRAFLATYPQSKLVPNAYYWIGESYYSQGNFGEALSAFKQVTTRFPRHHKTSDALLKVAMTYQKLGDVANAKASYQTLIANFPRSSAARIARSKKL